MKEKKKIFARQLRKRSTPAEEKVWEALRDKKFLNLKFRRQHVIEGFFVDFYCHKLKLGIELDGGIHDLQKEYDEARQHAIEAENVSMIRIENSEVMLDINILLDKIRQVWESYYNR